MRSWMIVLLLVGCASESGDDGSGVSTATLSGTDAGTTSTDGESSSAGTTDTSTDSTDSSSESTSESTTDGTDTSSTETGPDCDAPPDCETCWTCARDGACKGLYDACGADVGCVPSLFCIETTCTPEGLVQSCADDCCKSCQNTGACPAVDAALTCIEQQCAGLCGDISCP